MKSTWNGLCLGLVACLAAGAGAAQETPMSFGYAEAANSDTVKDLIQPWLDGVEKYSDGTIGTEFLGGGSVVTFQTAIQSLEGGLVDATMVATLYFRKELPINTLLVDYGAAFNDRYAALAALTEMVLEQCPECSAEAEQVGARVVFPWVSEPYNLICREPVNSLEDMKGKRVRATGLMALVVEEMGATPSNITIAELYESLQRGVVDCALASTYWLDTLSLKEVTKQIIDVDTIINISPTFISVGGDFLEGLTDDQKAALSLAVPEALANSIFTDVQHRNDVISENAATITLTPAPDWATVAMERAAEKMRAEAIEIAKNSGVENAEEITARFGALYEKWQAEFAGKEINQEQLAQFLAERFYGENPT